MTSCYFPGISIIVVALNAEKKLGTCLELLSKQDYPKDKLEILLVDGGSTDKTKEVASRFGAKVIDGGYPDNQEPRRFVGFQKSQNDILAYIDSDNFVTDPRWLQKMTLPFQDSEIVATQTLRYAHRKDLSAMNRYFALFGFNDPVVFYLRKADRVTHYQSIHHLPGKVLEEKEDYYKVQFSLDNLPTVGCNGFLVRKAAFERLQCQAEGFFHIDANVDLIQMGLDKYGIVKNDIIHATSDTFLRSVRKRITYMNKHHKQLNTLRRYKVFNFRRKSDVFHLVKYVVYSITFIKPLIDSFRGFIKKPDVAWFLHPFVCLGFVYSYGISVLRRS